MKVMLIKLRRTKSKPRSEKSVTTRFMLTLKKYAADILRSAADTASEFAERLSVRKEK